MSYMRPFLKNKSGCFIWCTETNRVKENEETKKEVLKKEQDKTLFADFKEMKISDLLGKHSK